MLVDELPMHGYLRKSTALLRDEKNNQIQCRKEVTGKGIFSIKTIEM